MILVRETKEEAGFEFGKGLKYLNKCCFCFL